MNERKHERHPQHLEGDVRDGHATGIGGGAQARGQRGGARPDVGAQDHGNGAAEGQEPLAREGENQPDGRGRGRHAGAEHGAEEKTQAGIRRQGYQHLARQAALRHRRHGLRHEAHAEEHEAEAEDGLSHALYEPAPPEEGEPESRRHQQEGEILDPEGEDLHGEGRADIRAEDDPQRLPEGHETGRHEADDHQRGRRGGLQQRGGERAGRHGAEPRARGARQQVSQMAPRGALEPFATELHAVEEKGDPAEELQEDHGARGVGVG